MELNPTLLLQMIRKTVIAPRAAAAEILGYGFAPQVGWLSLMLMAVLSSLLFLLSIGMMPPEMLAYFGSAIASPFQVTVMQWLSLLFFVSAVHVIGRICGGQGRFGGAVILVAWMQFVMFLLQLAQFVVLVLVPPLAILPSFITIYLFFHILSNFVAELHGFPSAAKVFLGMVMLVILLVLLLGRL